MKKSLLILLSVFSFTVYAGQTGYLFHNLSGGQGLTNSAVRDIAQDGKGYIWIATLKGLNRYDGYQIQQYYKSDNGLLSNCIERVLPIGGDSLLLATDEGLCLYDATKEEFKPITTPNHNRLVIYDMVDNGTTVFLATAMGLYSYDKPSKTVSRLHVEMLLRVTLDVDGNVWGMNPGVIYCYTPAGQIIRKIVSDELHVDRLVELSAIYSDSQGSLWLGTTECGVYHFDKIKDTFTPVEYGRQDREKMRYVRRMQEDMQGNLWIGTEAGLFIHNYADNSYTHFQEDTKKTQTGLTDNAIYAIFKSRENIMWVGTFFGGVNYTKLEDNYFEYIISDNGERGLKGKAVSNIIKDRNGSLWFASEDKGISILHKDGTIQYINKSTAPALSGDNVHALAEDSSGYVWAGNFVDGLHRINLKRKEVKTFKNTPGDTSGISCNSIYKLFVHNTDSMIIGTSRGVEVYHFKTETFTRFNPPGFPSVRTDDISKDVKGNLWFSTHDDGVFMYSPATGKTRAYRKGAQGCGQMVSNSIYSSHIDTNWRRWFGTSNGGLMFYDPAVDSMIVYGKNELMQRDIYAMQEDVYGYLWLSTDNGIYLFNTREKTFMHFKVPDNLISNQFNLSSGYKDEDKNIYFGSINGACRFNPSDFLLGVYNGTRNMRITFSDFKLFNKHVQPEHNGVLKSSIDKTSAIKLKHNMNALTFDFLAINYNENYHAQYTCESYLEGLETEWNVATQMPQSVSYNNLAPGKYTFRVRIQDNNGTSIHQRKIDITIKPHFLLSGFMLFVYAVLFLFLIYQIFRFYRLRMRDKMAVEIERMEKKNLRELNQLEKENLRKLNQHKLNFFTFITHEFKTPLSILIAVLEDIIPERNTITDGELGIIKRNIQRLQFLINQLLDFRSVETDHARIEYVKGDIIAYAKGIFELFIPVFKQKQIEYQFDASRKAFYTVFDHDKIEKIISNLLSNAFKHSSEKSEIRLSVHVSEDAKELTISCHNSSSYIRPEEREEVMQPFRKTGPQHMKFANTGIGLPLVNGLVQLLSGKVYIKSGPKRGTTFIVSLPVFKVSKRMIAADKKPEIINSPDIVADTIYTLNSSETDEDIAVGGKGKMTVLLVEDNSDINKILRKKLSGLYKVCTAYNGRKAVKLLKTQMVDIVVSDVMMPLLDGYELSKFIKTSKEYSHIPVILITSQSSKDSELQGLSSGADAYIEKPFTFDELNLRIINLLKTKGSIMEHYQAIKAFELNEKLSNKDEAFIQLLVQYVLDHLQDEKLDIDKMASHMNIGRTQLYNKLKLMVNLSTTEFINKIKIDVAKRKISETEYTFAEIAWELGFTNPSYFSKIFKRFTGMTPKEFKKGKGANEQLSGE